MKQENIVDIIISKKDFLPKKQRQLCEFLIKNQKAIGILTIADLAEKANVGTTTVVRVMKAIGYDSFNDFKKDFHQFTLDENQSTWWHLQKSFHSENPLTNSVNDTWTEINHVMNETLNKSLIENIEKTVHLILEKASVNILGLRTSKVLAIYLEKMLSEFFPRTRQLSNDSDFIFDNVSLLKEKDLMIIITISPFSVVSLEAAQYCYEHHIPIVLITDNYSCPIISYADVVLYIKGSEKQYSIAPAIALIEALVIEVGKRTSDYSVDRLERLGKLLKEKNITT